MKDRLVPGWVGAVGGAMLAALATAIGHAPELTYLMDVHPGVAGWVQGVGSIAAIGVAIYLSRGEARRRQLAEEEEQARALTFFTELAFRSANALSSAANLAETRQAGAIGELVFGHEALDLEQTQAAIDRLPFTSLDVPAGAVSSLLELRRHLVFAYAATIREAPLPTDLEVIRTGHRRAQEICAKLMALSGEAEARARMGRYLGSA